VTAVVGDEVDTGLDDATATTPGDGDRRAFRQFYDEAMPEVYRFVHSRCGGDVAFAEDVTQEVFVAAVGAARRGGTELTVAWAIAVAKNKLIDHYRMQGREARSLTLHHQADMQAGPSLDRAVIESVHVQRVLGRLPEPQRQAILLRYRDGLSVPEIAANLDRSVHAVESLLVRARDAFRRLYAEGLSDD
jgi:RNA polymerase sigma-70 factor, ECF subfamily